MKTNKTKQKKKRIPELDFKQDSKQGTGQPQIEDLEIISKAVILLQSKITLLAQAELRASQLKEEVFKIKTEEIPALMDQLNVSEVKMKDGSRVSIKPLVQASLPSEGAILKCKDGQARHEMRERLKRGFAFLRKSGAAALIKTLLKADFGKDAEAKAAKAIATLKKLGVQAEVSKNVHPQTLTAWVRERLEDGKPVDMETFKVFSGQIAEITTPNTEETL
jgi:hypothetical protein